MIAELKKRYGHKCTGIKLNYESFCEYTPEIKLPFCKAVCLSFNTSLLLYSSCLSCKGSQRSFGILKSDEELIIQMPNESKASKLTIEKALHDIPVFKEPVKNILLGIQEETEDIIVPDILYYK